LAAGPGSVSISPYQPRSLCGSASVFTGWDTSIGDATGQGAAAAALTRGPAGQTTEVANAALHLIGFAMVEVQSVGAQAAYLVVWLMAG
jgi:hypothetical protein